MKSISNTIIEKKIDNILKDMTFIHSHTIEKIEYIKDSFSTEFRTIDQYVERLFESHSKAYENIREINDRVQDTKEDILTALEYNKDYILSAIKNVEENLNRINKDQKQETIDLINNTKDYIIETQNKLIQNYTSRIITQIAFILGIAISVITEYDFYKEKILWVINFFLTKRKVHLDIKKKNFFFF